MDRKAVMIKITLVTYAKWLKELKTFLILFVAHNNFEDVWKSFLSFPSYKLEVYYFIFSVKSYRFFSFIHYLWTFYRNLSLAFLIADYKLILRMNGRKETASEKFFLSRVIFIHLPSYIKQEDVCKKEKIQLLPRIF